MGQLQFCRYMEGKVFLFHIGIKSQRELRAGGPSVKAEILLKERINHFEFAYHAGEWACRRV